MRQSKYSKRFLFLSLKFFKESCSLRHLMIFFAFSFHPCVSLEEAFALQINASSSNSFLSASQLQDHVEKTLAWNINWNITENIDSLNTKKMCHENRTSERRISDREIILENDSLDLLQLDGDSELDLANVLLVNNLNKTIDDLQEELDLSLEKELNLTLFQESLHNEMQELKSEFFNQTEKIDLQQAFLNEALENLETCKTQLVNQEEILKKKEEDQKIYEELISQIESQLAEALNKEDVYVQQINGMTVNLNEAQTQLDQEWAEKFKELQRQNELLSAEQMHAQALASKKMEGIKEDFRHRELLLLEQHQTALAKLSSKAEKEKAEFLQKSKSQVLRTKELESQLEKKTNEVATYKHAYQKAEETLNESKKEFTSRNVKETTSLFAAQEEIVQLKQQFALKEFELVNQVRQQKELIKELRLQAELDKKLSIRNLAELKTHFISVKETWKLAMMKIFEKQNQESQFSYDSYLKFKNELDLIFD